MSASPKEQASAHLTEVLSLSPTMRRLLWTVAQHKYGWAHCQPGFRCNRLRTAASLEQRGLLIVDRSNPYMPTCSATERGRGVIERLFPVSPFVLGTYDHQPGGWTPPDGALTARASGRSLVGAPKSVGGEKQDT